MNIIITKANTDDLPVIFDFTKKLNKDTNNKYDATVNVNFVESKGGTSYLEQAVAKDDRIVFLAKCDGKAIGYILAVIEKVGDFRILNAQCEIDFLWVETDYRGRGVGTRLIQEVEKWCKDNNIKRLLITVDPHNKNALSLYKKELFVECDLTLGKDL